uniref:Putative phosphatase phospho2 n=1 Tax=Pseudodiaptomus poplesia TaxID=213370 RepID=A0A1S6GLA0_9MAXI|nr:putative phosphatase phospho2 [Pseudodiaptomus poplesia]
MGPLLVFDFDHTITDKNTDVEVQELYSGGKISDIPEVAKLYSSAGWTEYMGTVFKLLWEQGVTKEAILSLMRTLELTPVMHQLITEAHNDLHAKIIIISDSNSVFIDEILKHRNLIEMVDRVFTNPASWTDKDLLTIQPFHHQEDCKLSSKNLCKGKIMEDYLGSCGEKFSSVAYVGDGRNDFCPALRLKEDDLVFVRKEYSLEKYIQKMKEDGHHIKAKVNYWTSAQEILDSMKEKAGGE